MAVSPTAPLPPIPPTVRVPAVATPPAVAAAPQASFTRLMAASSSPAGVPLDSGSVNAGRPDEGVSVLDRALIRDLVSAFERFGGTVQALGASPAFPGNLGSEPSPGRGSLTEGMRSIGTREALALYSAVSSINGSLQAITPEAGPGTASMLDLSA